MRDLQMSACDALIDLITDKSFPASRIYADDNLRSGKIIIFYYQAFVPWDKNSYIRIDIESDGAYVLSSKVQGVSSLNVVVSDIKIVDSWLTDLLTLPKEL